MSNTWGLLEETQDLISQDLNATPSTPAVTNPDAEEPELPLTQLTPAEHLFQERLQECLAAREIEGPQRPAQRPRNMPQHGLPGSGP